MGGKASALRLPYSTFKPQCWECASSLIRKQKPETVTKLRPNAKHGEEGHTHRVRLFNTRNTRVTLPLLSEVHHLASYTAPHGRIVSAEGVLLWCAWVLNKRTRRSDLLQTLKKNCSAAMRCLQHLGHFKRSPSPKNNWIFLRLRKSVNNNRQANSRRREGIRFSFICH